MTTDEIKDTLSPEEEQALGLQKSLHRDKDGVITLESGIRVKLRPVAAPLITEMQNRIPDPEIPIQILEDGRAVEQVTSKAYLRAVAEVESQKAKAALEAMAILGIQLVDGLPEDETWLLELALLGFETGDKLSNVEKEFLFKKYIAADTKVIVEIGRISGVTAESIASAKNSFQSPT